jgi:hypothetical protein
MKWCDLLWLLNDNVEHLQGVLNDPQWATHREWFRNRERIRLAQRREILDAVVPDALCLHALEGCRIRYLVEGDQLYGGWTDIHRDKLTAVEAYLRGGGEGLVDAVDRGVAQLQNPFRPVAFDPEWRTSTAVALAGQMYEARDFSAMPILADALQDAGCDNADILDHCRSPGPHVRGCWVVDLVLGKE